MFRRIRLAPPRSAPTAQVICYKTSYLQDPLYGQDNALVTNDFREPPDPDPESSLTGTLYEGYPDRGGLRGAAPRTPGCSGDRRPRGRPFPALVGIEYDRVNPCYPVERPIQVLSHSPLTCTASTATPTPPTTPTPAGPGCSTRAPCAGSSPSGRPPTTGASPGPAAGSPAGSPPTCCGPSPTARPPRSYPARDNLAQIHEWVGDPIATGHDLWGPKTCHESRYRAAIGAVRGAAARSPLAARRRIVGRRPAVGRPAAGGGGWTKKVTRDAHAADTGR